MTNQIFIVSDDQRFDLVKYMPNVMAMKARGTEFTMNRLNTSLCQPCRVSFMSGQLSKTTGVFANKETDLTDNGYDHTKTIAKGLSNAGVYCGLIGKYLNENGFSGGHPLTGTGWSYWRQQTGAGVGGAFGYDIWDGTSISNPGVYHLTYLYSQVVDFLATATEPWFLYLAPTSPHDPFTPLPQDNHKWSSFNYPIVKETNFSLRPAYVQARAALDADDLENIRGFARGHLRELTGLDRFIGDVLALVNPATTDIMFSTDNSVHLGEVRMKANLFANKNTPYLVTMNSPLIVAGPSWPHLPRTAEINVPTQSSVDMAATYNAIFGATPALGSQAGVDLRDVAVHPESYASRQLLHQIKIDQSDSNSFPQDQPDSDAISTATRHLIRYIGQTGSNKYELYALDTDPWELHNRANDNGNDPLGGTWANTVSTLDTALNALLS